MAPEREVVGRGSAAVAEAIREDIASGGYQVGRFLPATRELGARHGVTADTVRRGLKILQGEGLLASVPRHGFRVLSRANDPHRGCPIAYLLSAQGAEREWTGFNRALLGSLQAAASRRGWTVMGAGAADRSPEELLEDCIASRAWGLIIDVHSPEIAELARKAGLTAVMVDAWHEDAAVDSVYQDSFLGGMLAGQHLAAGGHRSASWFGPITESVHSMGRYSGAVMGLRRGSARLGSELEVELEDPDLVSKARRLLSGKKRPQAVLALWSNCAAAVGAAAADLGLRLGKDLDLVGWCSQEMYPTEYLPHFVPGEVPPAITWSIDELAATAVSRLAERREHPQMTPLRITVPTVLRMG
jgi:DNA-binding LacI/PurR family transcriptional regulator